VVAATACGGHLVQGSDFGGACLGGERLEGEDGSHQVQRRVENVGNVGAYVIAWDRQHMLQSCLC
jgi:hypothetical protein